MRQRFFALVAKLLGVQTYPPSSTPVAVIPLSRGRTVPVSM